MTDMLVYTRSGGPDLEGFEKAVPLPAPDDADPARHAWADARFATDIMAEHALFFAMLMPPEVVPQERDQALRFSPTIADLHTTITLGTRPSVGRVDWSRSGAGESEFDKEEVAAFWDNIMDESRPLRGPARC